MAFSFGNIGMFSAKLVYWHTISITLNRAGYTYMSFSQSLPIENAIRRDYSLTLFKAAVQKRTDIV